MNKVKQAMMELLPAIAYGDSVGLPYEAKNPVGIGSVTGLGYINNPYLGSHDAGTWSDDTHLSIAVAKSLIECDGFDLDDQADWHIKALEHVEGARYDPDLIPPVVTTDRKNGWGKSTTDSVKRLARGISPLESGAVNGGGNGVLMKMMPLLLWQVGRHTPKAKAEKQIEAFTRMTHRADEAVVSSLVHVEYVRALVGDRNNDPRNLLARTAVIAKRYEFKNGHEAITSNLLSDLGFAALRRQTALSREVILELTPRGGFHAPEALAMAYGSLAIEPEFPNAIYRAVELGGDADSVGSIVAALAILRKPGASKPHDYERVFDYERLSRLSRELADAAFKGKQRQ